MTKFTEILEDLNRVSGVRGTAISTVDGIIVTEQLQDRFSGEAVAGLTSFLISTTKRALDDDDLNLRRFTVYCTHGRMIMVSIGEAYLVVITDQFAKVGPLMAEVDDAAQRLRRVSKLNV